jgi:uncharacterized protein YoxC
MSTEGATVAQWGLNAAMLANPIGLIIAAIAALIAILAVLVIWLVKTAKAASAEGQLKAAQETTERMSKAADAAAESYNTLVESFERLEEKESALEGLT